MVSDDYNRIESESKNEEHIWNPERHVHRASCTEAGWNHNMLLVGCNSTPMGIASITTCMPFVHSMCHNFGVFRDSVCAMRMEIVHSGIASWCNGSAADFDSVSLKFES